MKIISTAPTAPTPSTTSTDDKNQNQIATVAFVKELIEQMKAEILATLSK